MILGMDTSAKTCGVALWDPGEQKAVAEYALTTGRYIHSRKLLAMIEQAMHDSSVDRASIQAIGVIEGPGSFTGVRIGITAAKAMAFAWQVPVYEVSALEVLYRAMAARTGTVVSLVDARNARVYAQAWSGEGLCILEAAQYSNDQLAEQLSGLLQDGSSLLLVGTGAQAYWSMWRESLAAYRLQLAPPELCSPRPATICRIAGARLAESTGRAPDIGHIMELTPSYLRRSSAERERTAVEDGDACGGSSRAF